MNFITISYTFDINTYYVYNKEESYKWYLAYVPLEIINFSNGPRYLENKREIENTNSVMPIVLGDFIENNKYTLHDGNHRCYCVKEMGYTHIPAVIYYKTINNLFIHI
jgi:hypothetical protein